MAVALCFFLCLMPCAAFAASTADAKEPIAIEKECGLTIYYGYEEISFSNQPVMLYKVAEVSPDFQYALTAPFAASGLILNGIQTVGEWNVVRSTLETLILAGNIAPVKTTETNASGQAIFTQLPPGLYLASAVEIAQDDLTCCFDSALVSLPALNADGLWQYQVTVAAKPQVLPPVQPDEKIELKVLKLWKGDEGRTDRPKSVEVEIFCDGTSYETVILSAENNWSYSWSAKDDGSSWSAIERNVPDGYTMTLEERTATFVLTNSRIPDDPDTPPVQPPQTGDTSNILLYTVLMFVSGTVLMILGITEKRKRYEETT